MKKINLNKDIVYSYLLVVILFILFIGDKIALKLIPENPNPNNTSFGGGQIVSANYNNENISEVTPSNIINLINAKGSFILILVRKDCYTCELLIDKKDALNESIYPLYFLDVSKYSSDDYLENLIKMDLRLYENRDLSPLSIKFQDGVLMDVLVGITKNKRLNEFFNQR